MITRAQQMLIEDGLPPELALATEAERKAEWKGVKLTKPKDLKVPAKDEDPATKALRKEIAAADEKKKAERLARLKQLKQEGQMATKKKPAKKMTKTAKVIAAALTMEGLKPKAAKKPAGPA